MNRIYAFVDEYVTEDNELGQRLARFGDEKHIWVKFEVPKYSILFNLFVDRVTELFMNSSSLRSDSFNGKH